MLDFREEYVRSEGTWVGGGGNGRPLEINCGDRQRRGLM